MGFKRENAERALVLNNNNLERSLDVLVKEQDEEDQEKQEEDVDMKDEPKGTNRDQITETQMNS
tara:strand:+ start:30 stop:221 length:192 start_codon:yes stop_codon:yes gene_type:complete